MTNKKREVTWITSYSNMTKAETEKRLNFRIRELKGKPVETMLAGIRPKLEAFGMDAIQATKEKVYDRMLEYVDVEGYPSEKDSNDRMLEYVDVEGYPSEKDNCNEASVNHLVCNIVYPIIRDFRRISKRHGVQLQSGKEIISVDDETGGTEEFVVMDMIGVGEESFILVIEAKRSSIAKALRQCLLAMYDMRAHNGGGKVYGFATTGEFWQMVEYDGASFQKSDTIVVAFESMDEEKEKWFKDCSVIVECIYAGLINGGVVKKVDLVATQ